MALSINNNLMALTAFNNLTKSYNALSKSVEKLSSGLRINGAADDAAGLAVRELMRSDVAVLNQGIRNANDAISMLQTMDGAASVIDEKLIRMKELAEQASTGTYSSAQRAIMDDEFQEMANEIDRIAKATDFNQIKLLNAGSGGTAATTQVLGVTEDVNDLGSTANFSSAFTQYGSGDTLTVSWTDNAGNLSSDSMTISADTTIGDVVSWLDTTMTGSADAAWTQSTGLSITDATSGSSDLSVSFGGGGSYAFSTTSSLGGVSGTDANEGQVRIHFGTGSSSAEDYYYIENQNMTKSGLGLDNLSIATQDSAAASLDTIDTAIVNKDQGRAHFGAMINRLENTVSTLTIQAENIAGSESLISDVDVAFEMTQFVNNQIKSQAAVAMLAQANTMPQMAMSLLGG